MAHFFPAASRMDVERPSSLRRTPTRSVLRGETGDDTPADGRLSRPSHINWLQSSLAASSQAGASMPKRPPSARLGRSASLSAIPAPSPLRRQSSLISNHSLQLDRLAGCQTDGPSAQAQAKPLSPISEQSYVPTPTSKRDLFPTDVEPSSPVSAGKPTPTWLCKTLGVWINSLFHAASTYSAFLRRPLKRSISATSTSSLGTSIYPPTLPPLNITPLDIRPVYPPVSHRAGPQLFSTVYEDTASERTGSFVTAPSVVGDLEDTETPLTGPDVRGPSGSTTLYSTGAVVPGGATVDPFTDSDRASIPFTTTPPSSSSSSGAAQARPRPPRVPTSGNNNNNSGTSDTFILRRLTFGSALSRPSFTAARRAALARLPPLPVLLFWAGFFAPWCWLIGGWLIAEGRWEDNGKARSALPLWRPRHHHRSSSSQKGKGKASDDLEKGAGAAKKKEEEEEAVAVAPTTSMRAHWAWWWPFAPAAPGAAVQKEKVVTFVKPYSAEVWVYRCRLAAVISALVLLTALIVTLVIVGGSSK